MKELSSFWAGMSERDRRILLLGAVIALLLLGWALVWQPLVAAHQAARKAQVEAAAQLAEVRQLAEQLALRTQSGGVAGSALSPLAAVEAVARDQRLLEQLKRLEAAGANGVQLMLENAPADALMRLLERLDQQYGLRITQAQIDPAAIGRVNASLNLQRGRP